MPYVQHTLALRRNVSASHRLQLIRHQAYNMRHAADSSHWPGSRHTQRLQRALCL